MRWTNKDPWRWRLAFAFLPQQVSEDGEMVWLQWYERRYRPDGSAIRSAIPVTARPR